MLRIFAFICVSLIFIQCKRKKCAEGEGDRYERAFNLPNFKEFIVEIPGDVEIYPDTLRTSSKLVVLAQTNVLDRIDISQSGGRVRISFSECLINHSNISFRIYVAGLEKIQVLSAAKVITHSNLYTDRFHLEGRASTQADISVYTPYLKTEMLNAGTLQLTGYARRHESQTASGTSVLARELLCDTAIINQQSFGNFECYAMGYLKAEIGGGILSFWGTDTVAVDTVIKAPGIFKDNR